MSTPTEEHSAAQVIERLAQDAAEIHTEEVAASVVMTKHHKDHVLTIHDLEKYQDEPRRIRETPIFRESDSFTKYLLSFMSPSTIVFFDDAAALFTAVIDYSEPPQPGLYPEKPRWGNHTARLQLQHSDEWNLWFARDKKFYSQIAFGRFLEENLIDIISPDGASLLEMVMNFEAHKSVSYRESTRLRSGITQFSYVEEEKPGTVEVPDSIVIRVPVFLGQPLEDVTLRFRYQIVDQKLSLAFEFVRAERLIRWAAARIVNKVKEETKSIVLFGKRA